MKKGEENEGGKESEDENDDIKVIENPTEKRNVKWRENVCM